MKQKKVEGKKITKKSKNSSLGKKIILENKEENAPEKTGWWTEQ